VVWTQSFYNNKSAILNSEFDQFRIPNSELKQNSSNDRERGVIQSSKVQDSKFKIQSQAELVSEFGACWKCGFVDDVLGGLVPSF
jgi:hypothetical protein